MMTCIPIRICVTTEITAAITSSAMNGLVSRAIAVAWLRPTSDTTTIKNPVTRKRFATAVSRCSQKCPVPECAEPKPRTRPRGVFIVSTLQHVAEHPHRDRERERADQRRDGKKLPLVWLEAVAGIPDEMPDAAEHVVQKRP